MALFPLRLFLGLTFVYAGIQKLSDPGYLHPGAPTYIGSQLHSFAHGTPGGFLLRTFALPQPKLAGIGVALLEIAIGLLVTAGLLTRVAAAVGLGLNLVLFLTNSWNTSPYFLGSDIVFVFAWLPFVLAGASGQPAVDAVLDRWAQRRRAAAPNARSSALGPALTRRGVLVEALGVAGVATLFIGGVSSLAKGSYHGTARKLGGAASKTSGASSTASNAAQPAKHQAAPKSKVPSGAVKLGPSSQLPSGQGATYTDPSTGETSIAIREGGSIRAFSAVCTHAGCTVGYQSGELVCPCHGGVFDAKTGAVVSGPPPSPLQQRKVIESGGSIYAVPS